MDEAADEKIKGGTIKYINVCGPVWMGKMLTDNQLSCKCLHRDNIKERVNFGCTNCWDRLKSSSQ